MIFEPILISYHRTVQTDYEALWLVAWVAQGRKNVWLALTSFRAFVLTKTRQPRSAIVKAARFSGDHLNIYAILAIRSKKAWDPRHSTCHLSAVSERKHTFRWVSICLNRYLIMTLSDIICKSLFASRFASRTSAQNSDANLRFLCKHLPWLWKGTNDPWMVIFRLSLSAQYFIDIMLILACPCIVLSMFIPFIFMEELGGVPYTVILIPFCPLFWDPVLTTCWAILSPTKLCLILL